MRVNFELTMEVSNIDDARLYGIESIAKFMNIAEAAVPAMVDIELKVTTPKREEDEPGAPFVVTLYGNVKHSIAKP